MANIRALIAIVLNIISILLYLMGGLFLEIRFLYLLVKTRWEEAVFTAVAAAVVLVIARTTQSGAEVVSGKREQKRREAERITHNRTVEEEAGKAASIYLELLQRQKAKAQEFDDIPF